MDKLIFYYSFVLKFSFYPRQNCMCKFNVILLLLIPKTLFFIKISFLSLIALRNVIGFSKPNQIALVYKPLHSRCMTSIVYIVTQLSSQRNNTSPIELNNFEIKENVVTTTWFSVARINMCPRKW